jgi:hypothetical protein
MLLKWRDTGKCPTEEEYCKMVIDKTGGLFRLAVGLMQACATKEGDADFAPLVNQLAMYFQIRDDLINLADAEYMKSKSYCEDLVSHKARNVTRSQRIIFYYLRLVQVLKIAYVSVLFRRKGNFRSPLSIVFVPTSQILAFCPFLSSAQLTKK